MNHSWTTIYWGPTLYDGRLNISGLFHACNKQQLHLYYTVIYGVLVVKEVVKQNESSLTATT